MSMNNNTLVYALSSKAQHSWGKFKEIFSMVCEDQERNGEKLDFIYSRLQTVRFLSDLGFCEFDFYNGSVYMCQPRLISIPTFGVPEAILIGARTPKLVEQLKKSVKTAGDKANISIEKNIGNLPDLVKIVSLDNSTLIKIANDCGILQNLGTPTAWNLANFSSTLSEFQRQLKFDKAADPNLERRTFSIAELNFVRGAGDPEASEKLVEYKPQYGNRVYWIWEGEKAAEINREFGQYLLLNLRGVNVLFYDRKTNRMGIPATAPLPLILARSAALCSGLVPRTIDIEIPLSQGRSRRSLISVYSNIPEVVAKKIADKLSQKLSPATL